MERMPLPSANAVEICAKLGFINVWFMGQP